MQISEHEIETEVLISKTQGRSLEQSFFNLRFLSDSGIRLPDSLHYIPIDAMVSLI